MPILGKPRQLVNAKNCDPRATTLGSTNAVNLSSARTTKRFPSPRCASAIQIVRPLESIAETQPEAGNVIETHEHAGDFKEP
jgi:hypothetical protein